MFDDVLNSFESCLNWISVEACANLRVLLFLRCISLYSRKDSINVTNVYIYNSPKENVR